DHSIKPTYYVNGDLVIYDQSLKPTYYVNGYLVI
ncbi:hypothetical protein KSS87_012831, partial [Heliosperma pusillum]